MKKGNQKSKAKIKSMKVPLKYHQNSFKQTIDGAIETVSEIEKHQPPLGKLDFKVHNNNMNIFKNPPLPSSSKSKKKTAKGLKKCHTLVSSTPYCDNKNKMGNRNCLLESPEGSPIQLDADENVLKTSNLRQLEGNESSEGSSVVYVGTERGDPDETLKKIATVASPTKNAFKLISDISLKRKVVSVKNNRSPSRHSDASTSAQSREDDRKIQTVVSHRSTPRKKKRNETLTDLNHDEQAVISTSESIREISILIPKLSVGMMSDSDKAEHRCSTSPSPSRKNEETHATVFRARTRSEKRNESMTVSNGNKTTCDGQLPTPASTKKAKDMQTSMKPVNFNGGTLASAEDSDDTCPTAARKNRSKTEAKKTKSVVSRRRKNRNTNKTNFNDDSENSDAETQQRSMELVNLAGSTNTVKPTTSNNESPKIYILEEIRQRKAQKQQKTTEVQSSSTSNIASRRIGLDRLSSARTVNRDWASDYKQHMNAKKKRFDDLITDLTEFAVNCRERELQDIRQLEGGLKDSSSQLSSSNSHASSNSSNRRFRLPNRITPYVNSCGVMNRKPVAPKVLENKSLDERQRTIESVISKLKDRVTENKQVQTSTHKKTHSRVSIFRRSAIRARNMTDQDTTLVPTVSHQNCICPNIYDSVKEGNPADCLGFSALKEDGLVENQDKPWRFSHSRKSVLAGENITVPSFIRPESQIESSNESWLSRTFHKPANNRQNIKHKSLQNNNRLSKQVLNYSSDEDSEVMNRLLPKNHTLVQGESKLQHGLKLRTYARTRQLSTQNSIINDAPDDEFVVVDKNTNNFINQSGHRRSLADVVSMLNYSAEVATPTKANQSREGLEKNRDKPKKVDQLSRSGVQHASKVPGKPCPLRYKNNARINKNKSLLSESEMEQRPETATKSKQANTYLPTPEQPAESNSNELQQSIQDKPKKVDMSRSGVQHASKVPGKPCPLRYKNNAKINKNKSLLSESEMEQGPETATKSKQANKYFPTPESNSSELQQSIQDDIGRENMDCQEEVASEVSEEAGPSPLPIPKKNKSLLVESGIERLSQSPARSKRPSKYFPTPEQPAASNSSKLQQRIQDDIERENMDCQEEVDSEVSEEAGPSRLPIPKKNKSLLVESGIEQLSQSPARSKRPSKYFPTPEQPAASNSSELQQSMQDDVALENLACEEQVASEQSEETAPSCRPKTKKNKALLVESGIKQLPKSSTKNAAKAISSSNQSAISNYIQLNQTNPDDVGCELSGLENPVTQENYNTNGLFTANVEDTNCKFKVPPKKSIQKRKTKSNNSSTNATSQLSEFSLRDIRMDEPTSSTSERKSSKAASRSQISRVSRNSFNTSRPLASVNIANVIPSEDGTRSLRKRTCRNTQFIQEVDFEGDKRRLVFVEQTTLAIPNYSKKRNSSNGNNKKKSRSMLRRTNLPVIDEREVDNDQPGPSSSCLMPPPPVRISTTQHARLQEITADSGFENSNSKTLQVQENTAIRKPKSTPLNLDDDISEPGVLDQEEPVPPTLDDPDINRNLTQSSVIQPPLNDVPIINMQEMTAFSGKQPPWKAYKQSGNLYVYESGNPPDGSIGYIRLKPRTEARSTEPRHHMTFFVIKGTGKIQLESHSHTANLGSGDYCYIPKGRNYTISNPSRCHLVITYKKH